jgi:hypothetical protein
MISDKKKAVYYVLGAAALITGVYVLANKEEVKRGLEWIKNSVKLKTKKDKNEE